MSNFLPDNYAVPEAESGYLRLTEGEHKFRILAPALIGYEYWNTEGKPVRSMDAPAGVPSDIRIDSYGNPERVKHFWAMTVWNYAEERVQILQVTQATILRAIEGYIREPDLGDPRGYDIKITREGKDKNSTKYSVMALPPKELPVSVKDQIEKGPKVNLQALLTGENPFESDAKVVADEVASGDIPF